MGDISKGRPSEKQGGPSQTPAACTSQVLETLLSCVFMPSCPQGRAIASLLLLRGTCYQPTWQRHPLCTRDDFLKPHIPIRRRTRAFLLLYAEAALGRGASRRVSRNQTKGRRSPLLLRPQRSPTSLSRKTGRRTTHPVLRLF